MFEKNSMLSFKCANDFISFYNSLEIYGDWKIVSGLMNDRGKRIQNKSYTNEIRTIFSKSNLFRRNISIAEIVSLLDTYTLMYRVLKCLKKNMCSKSMDDLSLYSEYKIDFSKNRRIDFVFEYGSRILLCEFRISSTFPNMSSMWSKKELELIIYKELMKNYVPNNIKIILFAFIGMPEYHGKIPIEKHILYNKKNIEFFVDYILEYLIN